MASIAFKLISNTLQLFNKAIGDGPVSKSTLKLDESVKKTSARAEKPLSPRVLGGPAVLSTKI
ncbi:MAG: hypothetical protein ACTSQH_07740 [Candidatus Hodarchaeales archaeon]